MRVDDVVAARQLFIAILAEPDCSRSDTTEYIHDELVCKLRVGRAEVGKAFADGIDRFETGSVEVGAGSLESAKSSYNYASRLTESSTPSTTSSTSACPARPLADNGCRVFSGLSSPGR